MTSPTAQASARGKASAEGAVAAVANEPRVAPQVVRELYDQEIAQLQSNAAVTNFIEIIAGRRVKARIKSKMKSGVIS